MSEFPELSVWYTYIPLPYRLSIHHFHFDIAGEARLARIDCEKSREAGDLEPTICEHVIVERKGHRKPASERELAITSTYREWIVAWSTQHLRFSASI